MARLPRYPGSSQSRLGGALRALALALAFAASAAGCKDRGEAPPKTPLVVKTALVTASSRPIAVTLTGDVQARVLAELSFRISGRVIERAVDVGAHVTKGQLLAKVDPAEQFADKAAAAASVSAAEAQLRLANANFERQKTLLGNGFTTRAAYDQAQEAQRTAEGSLDAARAQLGTAEEALGYTELRAPADGVITARNLEVGQVAQAAQSVYSLAQDGDRDAVFDVYESFFLNKVDQDSIRIALVSNPKVTTRGRVREVSPTIDPRSATVRVKVSIVDPPPEMTLGSPVAGTASRVAGDAIVVPWSALTAIGERPAVWIVGPDGKSVTRRPIAIGSYETASIVVASGLAPGDRIVTDGGKLLTEGQQVSFEGQRS